MSVLPKRKLKRLSHFTIQETFIFFLPGFNKLDNRAEVTSGYTLLMASSLVNTFFKTVIHFF